MMRNRLSFGKKISDLSRLRYILGVVFVAGGIVWIDRMKVKHLVPLRCKIHCFIHHATFRKCPAHQNEKKMINHGKVLRVILERLGPTFIKFGQILSLRADVVGEEIAQELKKLQSDTPPFPYQQVREIIKEELGGYPEKLFKSFAAKPIAAASLSQVHRGVLKNGTKVAIKVQRPGIHKIIEQDIHILFYIANLVERFMPEYQLYRPTQLVKEFAEWTLRELDFTTEGHSTDHFYKLFEDNNAINIPKIYWKFTTPVILTMNLIEGLHADDLVGMKKWRIHRDKIAINGVDALLKQFLIAGFFHADPHPGNFFVLKGDVLCLHDFGMVGYFTKDQRRELLSCFVAFVNKDTDGFEKHFLHLAITNEKSDIGEFRKDIAHILDEFYYSSKQPSITWAFFRIVNKGVKRDIRFPTDLVLFSKALITTEAMGLLLYPKFNFNKQFQPFVKKAYLEYFNPKKALKSLKSDIFDYVAFLKSFPEKAQRIMEKVEQGQMGMKIDTEELMGIKKEFDRQNDARILGIVLTAVIIMTGLLFHLEGKTQLLGIPLSNIGMGLAIVLLIWFIIKVRQNPVE